MLRIPFIALLICSISLSVFAQDSVQKANPVKPVTKYKSYKTGIVQTPATAPAGTKPATATPLHQTPVQKAPVQAKVDTTKPAVPVISDKSLNGQYQFLLTKVYHYQQPLIGDLWRSITDTINIDKRKLKEATAKLSVQTKTVDSLNKELTTKDQSLDASNARRDSVSLLGVPVTKAAYNLITWGLVLIFGITAAVVIMRSGSYNREAKYRIKLYNELEEEFKTYKAKANEKEKKLARELQTERNKLDELLGNS